MTRTTSLLSLCAFATLWSPQIAAQLDTKPLVENVDVDEKLGDHIDLSLKFNAADGREVALSELIDGSLPTVITPVYYSCPGLCTLVLNGVQQLVNASDLRLGEQYQIISVSFNTEDTVELAAKKAKNYYRAVSEPELAAKHWHFLTGSPENVNKLMDQIGFRYKRVGDEFSHPSVLALISPDGLITRYLYGVNYPVKDFRLSMVEASNGTVGSTLDKVLIYCFRYDPLAGKYVPYAWGIMRLGALLTLVFLAGLAAVLWRREWLNKRRLRRHA